MKNKPIRSTKAIIIEYWDCGMSEHTHFQEYEARTCINNREPIQVQNTSAMLLEPVEKRLPEIGYIRLPQIIGTKSTPGLIPVSRSTWWAGVNTGRFPKPVKLGERMVAWKVEDIREYIKKANQGERWCD